MTLYAQETVSQISSFKQENLKKKGKIYKKKPAKCKPQDTKLYTKFTSKLTNRLIQQNPATSNAMNFNPGYLKLDPISLDPGFSVIYHQLTQPLLIQTIFCFPGQFELARFCISNCIYLHFLHDGVCAKHIVFLVWVFTHLLVHPCCFSWPR